MRRLALWGVMSALVLLAGCGVKTEPPAASQEKPLPSWYLSPPKSDAVYLYGIGEAKTRKDAINGALEDVSAQLGVSISATYNANTTVKRGFREYATQEIDTGITSETGRLYIGTYEVADTFQRRYDSFFVLVRVEKRVLKDDLEQQLGRLYATVRSKHSLLPRSNVVQQSRLLAESSQMVDGNLSAVQALKTLQDGYSDTAYYTLKSQVDRQIESFRSSLTASLVPAGTSKPFADIIQAALSDKRIRIVPPSGEKTAALGITLEDSVIHSEAQGFFIVNVALNITVKDRKGEIVGSNRVNLKGLSPQGWDKAFDNAAVRLQKNIEAEGIMKVLGITMTL